MKNPKAIYKYTHDGEVGYMHYVVFEGSVVVLSKEDSLKVDYIQKNGTIKVTADIKHNDYTEVKCRVENNPEFVQSVYNYMQETNNSYFNDGIVGLCALVFEK